MIASNTKKPVPMHSGFEWAGTVARLHRGGKANRTGRRAALLGVLSSVYANATRGTRPTEVRSGPDRG